MNITNPLLENSRYYDPAQPAAPAKSGGQMGKEEFLQLLVAQMSNQDPLNPAQGSEYVAQLAQFSSVEQLISLNGSIGAQGTSLNQIVKGLNGIDEGQEALLKQLQSGGGPSLLSATHLIGRSVEVSGGHAMLENGRSGFDVRLSAPAASGTLVIRDSAGKVVRRLEVDALDAGTHRIDWNGHDEADEQLPDGSYTATFTARNAEGKAVSAEAFTRGEITRVSMTAGGLTAWIGGLAVPVSALSSVSS